ncbi:MAG: MinD/ParA family protein [Chloroflexi bacterium]|nr:MinD/ParA family protein [Chloroflexota bacterium]MBU1747178.1 MinD/ParA family protein [Chloroflexota bacterium]
MPHVVVIHSFHRSAGKSNVTANLAAAVAVRGKRVGVVDTTYDVTPEAVEQSGGRVFHVPPTVEASEIVQLMRDAHDVDSMSEGFRQIIQTLELDILLVDAHPGLSEEALRPIAISDTLVIVLRPEGPDFQGTSVIVDVAHRLDVPRICLVVNKVAPTLDYQAVASQIEQTYHCPVVAILPLLEEPLFPDSASAFYLQAPQHPFSQAIEQLADFILNSSG